ncbi:hypothetical protein SCLCIDRAFT_478492 [Scleroderma citrinum Foug A]|uniref:Heterokaryon incompatibility domain-containing protein n=1 Tax=Scleroderma citrinum Foug A TaxID=1036808 RepID=A0A0C2ZJK5_9AGAM|nr:hypothetical protein SCLCIDRAFT_478492 [Scleroderma citrinum Foug A]
MRLIKVKAFLEREKLFREMKPVDRRAKVLEFDDDAATEYAILSHRWVGQEVDYDEMVELAKMAAEERDEIRRRGSYRKILQSCKQAQKDRYEWLWVDTCCIDKRSSAELSEAINSMFRWYENAKVCYAYLHDVPSSSFPTARDKERYPEFNGWPEWFSRGWTLQELIAPSNIQFFNKDWKNIGDKKTLAPTLRYVTGIPEHILIDGLHGNRPCIAQIMSWAAHRTTTRVEDRAYSLMGLLDVNMPMLYGEGKKAFHRLQLEIIRISNDQSIFAWECNVRTGSVLADDPSDFQYCFDMELMGHDEFIEYIKADVPEEELDSIEDRLGTFLITNRGIQIWMLLRPYLDSPSRSHFQAWLPCRHGRWHPPVNISLVLWESNYYRCQVPCLGLEGPPRFCQVYLRYQDPPHRNATFEVDDSSLTENGFTCCDAYPEEFTGNALTLNGTDPLCVKVYSDRLTNHCFVVAFGQSFGKEWIRVIFDESTIFPRPSWRRDYTKDIYHEILVSTLEHAQYMDKARYGAERYGQVCIAQTCIPRTTRILRTSFVMWKSSKTCGVKLEVFHDPGFGDVSGEWSAFDVNGTDDPSCDWRGLMISGWPRNLYDSYEIDGVPGDFSAAPNGIEVSTDAFHTVFMSYVRE